MREESRSHPCEASRQEAQKLLQALDRGSIAREWSPVPNFLEAALEDTSLDIEVAGGFSGFGLCPVVFLSFSPLVSLKTEDRSIRLVDDFQHGSPKKKAARSAQNWPLRPESWGLDLPEPLIRQSPAWGF